MATPTFGILVGGGPAPGINGVISAATILACRRGARVIGILEGFKWLMEGDTSHVRPLDLAEAERIELLGGSALMTSRANPTKKAEHLKAVVESLDALGVDHLITIGGDDTASSSSGVAEAAGGRIKVAHVPKTIDNDLPLPNEIPTFGFETARQRASEVLARLMEDARTTPRWYFAILMGRKAGYLAVGSAKAAGAPITLVPEDFSERPLRLETVTRTLEGAIVKRAAVGRPYGVAVIAEGIGEVLDENDLTMLKDVERDEHGHIRLAEVPLGRVLRDAVRDELKRRGVKVTIVEKDVGYELRCSQPSAFDVDYTRDLGAGAVQTLLAGKSSVLISRQQGRIVPIPFADFVDPETGRARTRMVDTASDSHAISRALQERMEKGDLEDRRTLEAIARAAGLSPDEAKERYAPIC
jgi:6-phosphofructokinase